MKAFLAEHRALFGHDAAALARRGCSAKTPTRTTGCARSSGSRARLACRSSRRVLKAHTDGARRAGQRGQRLRRGPGGTGRGTRRAGPGARGLARRGSPRGRRWSSRRGLDGRGARGQRRRRAGASRKARRVRQRFQAPRAGGSAARNTLAADGSKRDHAACAGSVVFTSRARGEMFRVLVDAETGEAQVRHGLTEYISDASYRVFTSDSPTPMSPGHGDARHARSRRRSRARSSPRPRSTPPRRPTAGSTMA